MGRDVGRWPSEGAACLDEVWATINRGAMKCRGRGNIKPGLTLDVSRPSTNTSDEPKVVRWIYDRAPRNL